MSRMKDYVIDLMNDGVIFMPFKPLKFCSYPGCIALVESGRCQAHQIDYGQQRKHYDQTKRADYHKLYNTAKWLKLRQLILSEQPFCVICNDIGLIVRATEVDHIKDHCGDTALFYDCDNLQPLCKACHSSKTARTRGFARNKK